MATGQIGNHLNGFSVIDKRATPIAGTSTSPISATTYAAAQDVDAIDTQLATYDAVYWTSARLNQTCVTDKLYALRMAYDSSGIS